MNDLKNDPAAKAAELKQLCEFVRGEEPGLIPATADSIASYLQAKGIKDAEGIRAHLARHKEVNPHTIRTSSGAGGSYPPTTKQPAPEEKKTFPPASYEEAVVLSNITGKPLNWKPKVFNDTGMIDGMTPRQRLEAANAALHGKNGRGRR